VGANTGQERDLYHRYSLRVIWIEPIPWIFRRLTENIAGRQRQCALQAFVTDSDGAEVPFYVSNQSAASSIFGLHLDREIWPTVEYDRVIRVRTTRLASFLQREAIDLAGYDALVIDTQGSELLALRGAEEILPAFAFIKIGPRILGELERSFGRAQGTHS
jgi:FkbM family methyltransferase